MNDTPWIVEESYDFYSIRSADGDMHLTIGEGDKAMKRAERIVKAVNNRELLVEFVRACKEPGRMGLIKIGATAYALLADIDKESS